MTSDIYRIDRFTVPAAAHQEFLTRLHFIDALINLQPGCRGHRVFGRRLASGDTAIVTVAEWENPEAMVTARETVSAEYHKQGFDPAAFMQRLGITADMGAYSELI